MRKCSVQFSEKGRCWKMSKVQSLRGGQHIKQVQLNFQVALPRSEIQAVHFILVPFQILWRKFSYIELSQVSPFENVDVVPDGDSFTLANTYLKAHFSDQGLLQVKCI